MQMSVAQLAARIEGRVDGDGQAMVSGMAPLESAGAGEVGFLANAKYIKHMETTGAAAVIVGEDYSGMGVPPMSSSAGSAREQCEETHGRDARATKTHGQDAHATKTHSPCGRATPALIRCKDPYFAFRQAMVLFHGFRQAEFDGIDPRANIDPSAKLGPRVCVAAFATVSRGAAVGEGTVIYPGAYVGPGCRIGRDCIIYPNVTLYDGTILGDRVTIHAGSSIGHDGFGYSTHKGEDGVVRHEKIPAAGWVVLEDDVEIGACCAIDRATMGPTVIGAGTKFSNLVAIGHGSKLGKHCLLVAQSGIAGSVHVGNYCVFGGQAGVVGHVTIGDGAKASAQSGVTGDVAPGQEVGGSPALPLSQTRRVWLSLSRLPQLRNAVRRLVREMSAMKAGAGGAKDAKSNNWPEDF
jgi:UDP-3-O-[3-hydroxymyristoyl] glucosamine N-acyltransferase